MHHLPALSLSEIESFTLLEIDIRLELLKELNSDKKKAEQRDLASLIFYGVHYGYVASKSKNSNQVAKDFHKLMNSLLQQDEQPTNNDANDPEKELKNVFG
jgi:hypothetical protein